ncbi:MAG: His Kinase (Phospho-acceptor) protein [Lacunisphaera sp.]|nr:His Kinase (Phospho-acceptor) protein [Lacunisphaera sp.]
MTSTSQDPIVNPARPAAWKILVIEDDPNWRSLIELHFEEGGHQVLSAADGLAGLALAVEKPDVILCDIDLPRLNGFGVLEALRQQPALRDIPFIFLTGKSNRADQRKGMVRGADDYITKPFQHAELVEAITAVLAKRAALAEQLRRHTEEHQRELAAPWGHELLTPLNGILGAAALLESEYASISRPELREMASSIRISAERQLSLARKLMQHFQLEQLTDNNWSDPGAAVDAGNAVEDEALSAAKRASRSTDLHVVCAPAVVRISTGWLQSAVAELVDNAFKFSPGGAGVTVTGREEGRLYRIEVIDRGPGMSPAERGGIAAFTQFGRARREQQGMGLGLSIVQKIAALHRGSLQFEPGPDGLGLHAVLKLPLAE